MIKAILYDNRSGYQLQERSAHFPEAAIRPIDEICRSLSDFNYRQGQQSPLAFRYSPLKDSKNHCLFSVIFRSTSNSRPYNQAVNFLMDSHSACDFLEQSLGEIVPNVTDLARNILDRPNTIKEDYTHDLILPQNKRSAFPPHDSHQIPTGVLLLGASYAEEMPVKKQFFFNGFQAEAEIEGLLSLLPSQKRIGISFQTGALSAKECRNITLNFTDSVDPSNFNDFCNGGGDTAKYFYSPKEISLDRKETAKANAIDRLCTRTGPDLFRLFLESSRLSDCLNAAQNCTPQHLSPMLDLLPQSAFNAGLKNGTIPRSILRDLAYEGSVKIKNYQNSLYSADRNLYQDYDSSDGQDSPARGKNHRNSRHGKFYDSASSSRLSRHPWLKICFAILSFASILFLFFSGFHIIPGAESEIVVSFTASALNAMVSKGLLVLCSVLFAGIILSIKHSKS